MACRAIVKISSKLGNRWAKPADILNIPGDPWRVLCAPEPGQGHTFMSTSGCSAWPPCRAPCSPFPPIFPRTMSTISPFPPETDQAGLRGWCGCQWCANYTHASGRPCMLSRQKRRAAHQGPDGLRRRGAVRWPWPLPTSGPLHRTAALRSNRNCHGSRSACSAAF